MSKTHVMKLNDTPFEATKAGLKTIEVRLNDERRKDIVIGDKLEFHRISSNEKLKVSVLSVRFYKTLKELTQKEDIVKTGGIYKDQKDWMDSVSGYYSQENQNRHGLLAIEIKLLGGDK